MIESILDNEETAMRTDFESTHMVEMFGPDDSSNQFEFTIGLECVSPSFHGFFDPRVGGEPPSGPEFEVTTIAVPVPKVNYKGVVDGHEIELHLTYNQFCAIVGQEICEKIVDQAMYRATESGDF
jgi:hypothetical protein